MEKQLYAEDPRFARSVRKKVPRLDEARRAKLGVVVLLVGFAALIAFFVTSSLLAGVTAFAAMVAGIVLIASSLRDLNVGRGATPEGKNALLGARLQDWEQRFRQRYKRP